MSASNFAETAYLTAAFIDGEVFTDIFIGLSTADPTEDGSGIAEPAGGSYARVQYSDNTLDPTAANWSVTNDVATNANDVDFGTATGSWGTVTHFFLSDAISAGNMLHFAVLTASKVIGNGDPVKFPASTLTVTAD